MQSIKLQNIDPDNERATIIKRKIESRVFLNKQFTRTEVKQKEIKQLPIIHF